MLQPVSVQFGKTLMYPFRLDSDGGDHRQEKCDTFYQRLGQRQTNGSHTIKGHDVFIATVRNSNTNSTTPLGVQIYTGPGEAPKALQDFFESCDMLHPSPVVAEDYNISPPIDDDEGQFKIVESSQLDTEALNLITSDNKKALLPKQVIITSYDSELDLRQALNDNTNDQKTIEDDRSTYRSVFHLEGELLGKTTQTELLPATKKPVSEEEISTLI